MEDFIEEANLEQIHQIEKRVEEKRRKLEDISAKK